MHKADSYSDSGVTIEVNGGARGEEDYSSSGPGVAGSDGQIQLIPSVSVTSLILFVDDNLNNVELHLHTNKSSFSLIAFTRLAIWDMESAAVTILHH